MALKAGSVKRWRRRLLRLALAGTTLGFAAASYFREGINPLDTLPTLANPASWVAVWAPLAIVAVTCASLVLALARRDHRLNSDRILLIQGAATFAAIGTSAYDLCRETRLAWLPAFGGCHCWLTGAAALCAALLTTSLLYLVGLFSRRVIRAIAEHRTRYLRRHLHRRYAGRIRRVRSLRRPLTRLRLIVFRGPPSPRIAQPFLRPI